MRPFFNYFGSKWTMAKHYGPPRRPLVIEPFAGSAGYSLRWDCRDVALYDKSETVCLMWDWLINCSEGDVRRLPVSFRSMDEFLALGEAERRIIRANVVYGGMADAEPVLPDWFIHWCRTGEHVGFALSGKRRGMSDVSIFRWDARRRQRMIDQKPMIAAWTIERMDYRDIPMREAHWHVDPPYVGDISKSYRENEVDYGHLADWCRNLPGAVDVCEREGADWLPFEFLHMSRMGKTREAVWRKDREQDLFMEAA